MIVEDSGMDTTEASVFCRSISNMEFLYGEAYRHFQTGLEEDAEVLMSNVRCTGHEDSILQCAADFLPAQVFNPIAYVKCYNGGNSYHYFSEQFLFFLVFFKIAYPLQDILDNS